MSTTSATLYDPFYEHAACGLGFVAQIDGRVSHEIVAQGLEILLNLAHRGATGSDEDTGDGAGIMLQIPHTFLQCECARLGFELPPAGAYSVGVLFLSPDDEHRHACERELERIAAEEGQPVLGWRDVPVRPEHCGRLARSVLPVVRQVFLARNITDEARYARQLYVIRRRLHWLVRERWSDPDRCYVVSLSARTVVYKGLLRGPQVPLFYPDLVDRAVHSALALIHSRFSTNTMGSWPLAHPFRFVAHNGEINALRGNINWMRAHEHALQRRIFADEGIELGPIIQPGGSDTSAFDNALEFLTLSGRSLPHAIMTMVPEAWETDPGMDADRRAFYQYTSSLMAPWDGPAAIAFSDGTLVGATLDRNGLRPARYSITRDGRVILASEEGALPVPPEDVVSRWRLQPGRMVVVDTAAGVVLNDGEVKGQVVRQRPYRRWVDRGMVSLSDLPESHRKPRRIDPATRLEQQQAFGYTTEDLELILAPMASSGKEPDGSMGTDTPLAILSQRPQLLFSYFQQLFAQVSNPPIDSLRERLVMSLQMPLGPLNILAEGPGPYPRILLDHPILSDAELARMQDLTGNPLRAATLCALFPVERGATALQVAVEALCRDAVQAISEGAGILILSDRGVDGDYAPIPSLLALSAVHHCLVRGGLRGGAGLVVETAEAREVHHMALLVGYGAAAINPYGAFDAIESLVAHGSLGGITPERARDNYCDALCTGLLKVISKMGISTLVSYCGAQIFEAVGLDRDLMQGHFTGTASRLGGIDLEGIAAETLARHARAFGHLQDMPDDLEAGGQYALRVNGERHAWDDVAIVNLQRAVRSSRVEPFRAFSEHVDREAARGGTLRGLLGLRADPIPLDEVESWEEIVTRFSTGAMSFGSLSREAHETLAVAMNRLGGKSNTGEGGEDPARFAPLPNGDSRRSAIKQIASGRFGVTTEYLVNADVLQIKMAQGSKPGEGGQLPGHKVSEDIARTRHSIPGVGLISPPPHHDIYSIEDLAQLIHDLKNVNPRADISVKLVAEIGVGTIAAGVAKARADHITISGYDGGTGASPLSSIKHAGLPWELGLAEAQQVLVRNNLRGRVRLQVDGGLKTGRDVVIAALLGADECAFSTAPLVAGGCILMRVCHLNTCPVGIATQDPELRRRFIGQPEHVVNYFYFLANEVRLLMAELGFRRFEEMVGQVDRLHPLPLLDHPRARTLDLSPIVHPPAAPDRPLRHTKRQQHNLEDAFDHELIRRCRPALEDRTPVHLDDLPIRNINRTVGAMLSGEIVRLHGPEGLPDGTIHLEFRGVAGQSFGAWGTSGVTLELHGETADYAGKGLSGGRIVVAPPSNAGYEPERSIVAGNVTLYGATSGEAYFRGVAGERFAVRNSGAAAVVEGVGDHACEYMTGGTVVVLGATGRNFAAGMSGGTAFVLDMWRRFAGFCNGDMVGLETVESAEDHTLLRHLLQEHLRWTGSSVAQRVLLHWHEYLPRFVKVMPNDLARVLAERHAADLSEERAV